MSVTAAGTTLNSLRHLWRRLGGRLPQAAPVNLSGKHIIITGASAGSVGYATAKTLAAWGATVIVTARSNAPALAEKLRAELKQELRQEPGLQKQSVQVFAHALDLTYADSVVAFCHWYHQQFGEHLDVLINNAGIHADLMARWQHPKLSEDGFELHWRTNYLGTLHLTYSLLPLLRANAAQRGEARVIFVASHLHERGYNSELFQRNRPYHSWDAYGLSKLALVHTAFEMQRRFAHSQHIQSYALHPGAIASNIALRGVEEHPLVKKMLTFVNPIQSLFLLTPMQGAQTQILCASQPDLIGGRYFECCKAAPASAETQNTEVAARLWLQTQHWITRNLPLPDYLPNNKMQNETLENTQSCQHTP